MSLTDGPHSRLSGTPVATATWMRSVSGQSHPVVCGSQSATPTGQAETPDAEAVASRRGLRPTQQPTVKGMEDSSRGTEASNACGLHDMHGNVWEWCWDGYDARYYRQSPVADPSGPLQATGRVTRGGAGSATPARPVGGSRDGLAHECRVSVAQRYPLADTVGAATSERRAFPRYRVPTWECPLRRFCVSSASPNGTRAYPAGWHAQSAAMGVIHPGRRTHPGGVAHPERSDRRDRSRRRHTRGDNCSLASFLLKPRSSQTQGVPPRRRCKSRCLMPSTTMRALSPT